eukprot:3992641-Prymnesium_polylepis.1
MQAMLRTGPPSLVSIGQMPATSPQASFASDTAGMVSYPALEGSSLAEAKMQRQIQLLTQRLEQQLEGESERRKREESERETEKLEANRKLIAAEEENRKLKAQLGQDDGMASDAFRAASESQTAQPLPRVAATPHSLRSAPPLLAAPRRLLTRDSAACCSAAAHSKALSEG